MIQVQGVSRSFGRTIALADVSFDVASGEIVALLGPNGAGKTTATRIIGGILRPDTGDAVVDGVSVRADPNAVREKCGLVSDAPALYERMTLRRYLRFFAGLFDVDAADARIASLVSLLALGDVIDKQLGAFSRGMKQKVAIARALLHDPPVLLLDEPTTALDPAMTRTLRDLIVSLRAEHRAIVLCTHDLDEAQRISDRVVILDRGRVARIARTDELRQGGRPVFRLELVGDAAPARRVLASMGLDGEPAAGDRNGRAVLRYVTDEPERTNPALLRALLAADVTVVALVPERRSLEEAYFATLHEAGS